MPGESMCFDARIRYWEEEWLSRLLEDAIRLKGETSADEPSTTLPTGKEVSGGRMVVSSE